MNWIDIKDRAPRHRQEVLVAAGDIVTAATYYHDPNGYIFFGACGFRTLDEWEWDFRDIDVTHWQPLPDPPRR